MMSFVSCYLQHSERKVHLVSCKFDIIIIIIIIGIVFVQALCFRVWLFFFLFVLRHSTFLPILTTIVFLNIIHFNYKFFKKYLI